MKFCSQFLLVFFLTTLLPLSGCHRPASLPNVVMIVVDTLRADRLGAYGSALGLTPFLDGLAKRGTLFRNAYATSSWTPPSVASLFTSRYPRQHRVSTGYRKLADEEVTLAEKLLAQRYATAGFSANLRLTTKLGYSQGFEHWVRHSKLRDKPRGKLLREGGLKWLDDRDSTSRQAPFFLYLQYMEPHAPYQPPETFRNKFARPADESESSSANDKLLLLMLSDISDHEGYLLESLYNAEVAAVDAEIELLFAGLERRGLLENTIVLVTADHGEEFRDHGSFSHGTSLYNELVRVPLILLAPGFEAGHAVDENVSLIDIAPTILDLLGLPPEPRFVGRSLVPLLRPKTLLGLRWSADEGRVFRDEPVLLELAKPDAKDRRRHRAGLIDDKLKLLVNKDRTTSLFDLELDPGERHPRPSTDRATIRLASTLHELQSILQESQSAKTDDVPMDDALRERLRALGYSP